MEQLLAGLRAAGEPTRLRLIALLSRSELTVTELTQILRQSQPRVSRHLKLLCEAGLLDRFREGSWVFYRLARIGEGARLAEVLTDFVPESDLTVARDLERLESVRGARAARAADYFRANAVEWNSIRSLYVPEEKVEAAVTGLAGEREIDGFVDLGTGTGRMLELFGPKAKWGLGIDLSAEMLAFARANLEKPEYQHCSVRQADLYDLPIQDQSADLVTLHQVLHYLDDPLGAIGEAGRILKPGGRLIIADFAPHELDYLREDQAHRRLGFARDEISGWLRECGLETSDVLTLPPEGAEDAKLTVLVWVGDMPTDGVVPVRKARVHDLLGAK